MYYLVLIDNQNEQRIVDSKESLKELRESAEDSFTKEEINNSNLVKFVKGRKADVYSVVSCNNAQFTDPKDVSDFITLVKSGEIMTTEYFYNMEHSENYLSYFDYATSRFFEYKNSELV